MTEHKIPWDIKQQVLWIVRGYPRSRKEHLERRRDILEQGGEKYTTVTVNGEERRVFMPSAHNASRTTEDRELQLEALEKTLAFRQMRAVEHARDRIGAGLPEMLQDALRDAIMKNCIDRVKFPFERLYIAGISRKSFYRYKDAFIWDIANELGLL